MTQMTDSVQAAFDRFRPWQELLEAVFAIGAMICGLVLTFDAVDILGNLLERLKTTSGILTRPFGAWSLDYIGTLLFSLFEVVMTGMIFVISHHDRLVTAMLLLAGGAWALGKLRLGASGE